MSDILSQAEIDELLNALSAGADSEIDEESDSDAASAKTYDFRTANRFPKEQIRTINIVFQTYAQLLSNMLTNILRVTCECEVLSVEELSFNEFNNSLPSPVILAIFNSPPMVGSQLMQISPEVGYMLINRLFGGSLPGNDSGKQFTEIELTLVEHVLRQLMGCFEEAWEKVLETKAQIERIETSSQFAQIVGLNDPIAIVTLNLTVGEEEGLISICLPHMSLEPLAKNLNTRQLYSTNTAQDDRNIEKLGDQKSGKILETPVSLVTYFGDTSATVSDIVNLQVGDVIRLSHTTDDPLYIKVEHIPKFRVKIGTSGSQYAVQITEIIKEGNEDESFAG